jgi:hypothetical protein
MDRLTRSTVWTAAMVLAIFVLMPSAPAQSAESMPDVTANGDGSCTVHYRTRSDIHINNGTTYHQEEMRGKKSGIIYVPDRTYLCQSGHLSVVK